MNGRVSVSFDSIIGSCVPRPRLPGSHGWSAVELFKYSFYYLPSLFGDLCLFNTKVLGQRGVICLVFIGYRFQWSIFQKSTSLWNTPRWNLLIFILRHLNFILVHWSSWIINFFCPKCASNIYLQLKTRVELCWSRFSRNYCFGNLLMSFLWLLLVALYLIVLWTNKLQLIYNFDKSSRLHRSESWPFQVLIERIIVNLSNHTIPSLVNS